MIKRLGFDEFYLTNLMTFLNHWLSFSAKIQFPGSAKDAYFVEKKGIIEYSFAECR